MKKILVLSLTILLVNTIIIGLFMSGFADQANDVQIQNNNESNSSPRSGPRQNLYEAYYNKTFSIDKSWELENVSIVIFVQTMDQTQKNKESGGSAGSFGSAEVLQSLINNLNGSEVRTSCCRKVFCELITATWCSNCPAADGAFDRISRDTDYFPGKTTMVEIHPSSSGDFYNTDSLARHNWYNHGNSHPTAIFDGLYCLTGGNSNANSTIRDTSYKSIIDKRQPNLPVVNLVTFGNKTETNGWVNVSVELIYPTPLRNLKVHFWVVEDVYPYKTSHDAYLRHTLRDALTPEDFSPPNHPPKVKSDLPDVEIIEDGLDSTTIQLAPAFDDEDLDVLTFSSDRDNNFKQNITVEIDDTGNVTLTPDADWNGVEDITFYADDGRAEPVEQLVKVTVSSVNDAPVVAQPMLDFAMYEDIAIEDKFDLNYVFNDVDLDLKLNSQPQQPLVFSYSGNSNIDVSITNGWVSFDPKPDWNGNETITITAQDPESETASDDVKIWVRSDNDPPVLSKPMPTAMLKEDETLEDFIDLNDYFNDNDGDALYFDVIEPDNIEVELNYKKDFIYVSIYPSENYWGTDNITFNAMDIPGSDPVVGIMEVYVDSVNDPPILNETDDWILISSSAKINEDIITISEDEPFEIYVTAYDPADNDPITFSDDTTLFEIDPITGKISFTPTNENVGSYDVKITVDDGQSKNNIDEYSVTFDVENVNDPPETPRIISPTDGNTYKDNQEIPFKGICDDPDLDIPNSDESLFFEWITDEDSNPLSFDSEFSTKLKAGGHTITLIVRDNNGAKSSAEINITVNIDETLDTDLDGVPDYLDDDDDGDGMPDDWEDKYPSILDPLDSSDADDDPDKDGFSNLDEYLGSDGSPVGDDSTNPTRKTSHPKSGSSGGDEGSESVLNGSTIAAIMGVIIVIIVLVILFFFIKDRKSAKSDEGNVQEPESQEQEQTMQPQPTTDPTPTSSQQQQYVPGPTPEQEPSQPQNHIPIKNNDQPTQGPGPLTQMQDSEQMNLNLNQPQTNETILGSHNQNLNPNNQKEL
jgi:hypothetical protein